MIKLKILFVIYIFSLLINYDFYVNAYYEQGEEIIENNKPEYRSIDDLLKELKEERKLINQQKLDEINQKNFKNKIKMEKVKVKYILKNQQNLKRILIMKISLN